MPNHAQKYLNFFFGGNLVCPVSVFLLSINPPNVINPYKHLVENFPVSRLLHLADHLNPLLQDVLHCSLLHSLYLSKPQFQFLLFASATVDFFFEIKGRSSAAQLSKDKEVYVQKAPLGTKHYGPRTGT
jgi:hypothetical protein